MAWDVFETLVARRPHEQRKNLEAPVYPRSQPVVVVAASPEQVRYWELSRELGYRPQGLEDNTLARALQALEIEVFDRDTVEAFLTATCHRLGEKWRYEWRPVSCEGLVAFGLETYRLPIPIRVLERMSKLKARVPKIVYYVSEITNQPRADPFLLAVLENSNYVIDAWDEPGFTG